MVVGQQAMLNLKLNGTVSEGYVAIIEIRDKDGVTQAIVWKEGNATTGASTGVRIPWTAPQSGDFQAVAFVISTFKSPMVLSQVSKSTVKVVASQAELDKLVPPIGTPGTEPPVIPPKSSAYTFMVYMVASDLESTGYYATLDIKEMMKVGSTENVNVIVQTGGSANSTIDDVRFIDFTKVQRHLILKDGIKTVQDLGEKNMASSSTLRDFVTWGLQEYPAEKYSIILWDHGAGMIGFGYDNIYGDILDLSELREGLFPAVQKGEQLDVIGFDACLMATVEVANALSGRGSYLVASEELEPAWGLDYTAILSAIDNNPKQDGIALGKVISDSYLAYAREQGNQFENYNGDKLLTMSVIDLQKIPDLYKDVGFVGDYFDQRGGDIEATHALTKAIRETERYGESGKSGTGHLDLYHLAENVDKEFPGSAGVGTNVRTHVDDAVVYKVGGDARKDSHGISIFMQVEEYQANAPYLKYIVGKWISVLTGVRQTLEKDITPPDVLLSIGKDKVIVGSVEGNDIDYISTYVTQSNESALNLKILSVVDEAPSSIIKSDGSVSYNWTRKIMSLCNDNQTDCKPTSITFEKNGATEFAYIPVRIESDRFNGTVVLIYTVDANKFKFLGGWPGVDESGNAQRELVPLVDGDRIYPFTYVIQQDLYSGDTSYDRVEDPAPMIVSTGFGPAYHKYSGEYVLSISACDYSGNCDISRDFKFKVK